MSKLFPNGFYVNPFTALCFILSLLIVSCAPEEEDIISPDDGIEKRHEAHVQFLVKTGFNRDEIVFENGQFIIDDDILISEEEVAGYMELERTGASHGRTQHYRGTYLVGDNYVTNIQFYISSDVSSSWASAIRQAIDQWNNVNGTRLFLSEVSSSGAANTVINTAYSNSNWVARAYLPSWRRRPGHMMTINTRYNSLDSGRKLFTIVHEMGHIFGLYHTDQNQGIFIQGTPQVDPNSVMNSYVLPWNGFTSGDMSAVQIIYPE